MNNGRLFIFFILVAVFMPSMASGTDAGQSNSESHSLIIDSPVEQQADSEEVNESMDDIDSALVQLIEAPDKKEFAERNGIDYRNGRVRVVVEMDETFTLPGGYNTTNELNHTGQGENLVQVRVPIGELVSLSDETGVKYVRLPLRGEPSQETEPEHPEQTEDEDNSDESNGGSESSGSNGTQITQQIDEGDDQNEENIRDEEGLASFMGGVVPALAIILTAAYARRKL